MAVERQRWTARAEKPRAKDLPLARPAAAGSVGESSPPLVLDFSSTPETVVSSPTLRAWGWISSHVLSQSAEALVPPLSREGQRFLEDRDAFHRLEPSLRDDRSSHPPADTSMTPPTGYRRFDIASGVANAFVLHSSPPDPDEASVAEWLRRPWPGVVPGFARSDRSAPDRFLQPVSLAARCAANFTTQIGRASW